MRASILLIFLFACLATRGGAQTRENLGPGVNTRADELYPVISADGKTLYFDRRGSPQNIGSDDDDIWVSTLQEDGTWGAARNIGEPLNNRYYNYVCSALPDDRTLLLGNRYLPGGKMDAGVSITAQVGGNWMFPSNLNIQNFKNVARCSEYCLSPDGAVMIMSINPVDSAAPRDLYVSFKLHGVTWSEPQNIGALNNPDTDEITPFIAADGKTLYFSSDRPGGFGSQDVYMARRTDDSWMFWTKPENLGPAVNTPDWDAYYTIPASGEYAYFVSNTEGRGGTDIFRILLPESMRPRPVVIVRGKVHDPLNNPLGAVIRYEHLPEGKELGTALSDSATGAYQLALSGGLRYGVRAERPGYLPVNENLDLTALKRYSEEERDLTLVPVEKGQTVRLNNIFFEFDRAELTPDSRAELDRLVAFLRSRPEIRIEVSGHTDNVGADDYNLRLSQQRAQAVVDFLIAARIEPARLSAKGYGKARPVDTNDTDAGRQKNRRVEFTIQ